MSFDMRREAWVGDAACRGVSPDIMVPDRDHAKRNIPIAKGVCAGCKVRELCLEAALVHKILPGVYGGLTQQDRTAIRRERGLIAVRVDK